MTNWYRIVTADVSNLPDAIAWYEEQLLGARNEVSIRGNLEANSRLIPGIVEFRFNQLQEVEALLEWLNIQLRKKRSEIFKKYTENYNRALTSRDAEKYVDGEPEVCDMDAIVNEFALVRNKFLGLTKALDIKQWQLSNVVKLRVAGMEDAELR